MTPTQRTLAYLRSKLEMDADVAERWIGPPAGPRVRRDLFGFADIVACSEDRGIVAVQATSTANVSARIKKIRDEPKAFTWLRSGGRVWVIGWSKKGAAGKRKLWTPRVVEVLREDDVELEEAA